MFQKKSLGQNFLKSDSAISAIIEASEINPQDTVLEIGPGEGVLTEHLLKLAERVVVVEKDHRLIPFLKERFYKEIKNDRLDIIEKDILEFNPKQITNYKVVANIPYYITGQILRMFMETKNQPSLMVLMVQKEVADRIVARDKKESLLSISVKVFGDPKFVKKVPAGSFVPAPKVDSAILQIKNISNKKLSGVNMVNFFEILHKGFAHKRKQLLSNLSQYYDKNLLINAFNNNGLGEKVRAEDLTVDNWVSLCKELNQKK